MNYKFLFSFCYCLLSLSAFSNLDFTIYQRLENNPKIQLKSESFRIDTQYDEQLYLFAQILNMLQKDSLIPNESTLIYFDYLDTFREEEVIFEITQKDSIDWWSIDKFQTDTIIGTKILIKDSTLIPTSIFSKIENHFGITIPNSYFSEKIELDSNVYWKNKMFHFTHEQDTLKLETIYFVHEADNYSLIFDTPLSFYYKSEKGFGKRQNLQFDKDFTDYKYWFEFWAEEVPYEPKLFLYFGDLSTKTLYHWPRDTVINQYYWKEEAMFEQPVTKKKNKNPFLPLSLFFLASSIFFFIKWQSKTKSVSETNSLGTFVFWLIMYTVEPA